MKTAPLLTVLALTLAACAAQGPSPYQEELDRLIAQCAARGGVLAPTGGTPSSNPALDNACHVPGGRITR